MTLVNTHLANMGRRLAGSYESASAPPKTRDRGGPDASVGATASGPVFELRLTDSVQAILLLAAKAQGVAPGELVARAVVFYASEAVGMPGLCDELTRVPDFPVRGPNRFQDCGGP